MPTTTPPQPAPPLAAVLFALWGQAVLEGRTSLDEAATAIGGGRMHRLTGFPGDPEPITLAVALGRLRVAGVQRLGVALPVPGDPVGVAGPREFTEAAVAAGQAVVVPSRRLGLVPTVPGGDLGSLVHWQVWADVPPPPAAETVSAASRLLREAVLDASGALAELDVPVAPAVDSGPAGHLQTPPGMDPRAHELFDRAYRLVAGLQRAIADPGVTTSATLDARRRLALVPVERMARRALIAACQPAMAALGRP